MHRSRQRSCHSKRSDLNIFNKTYCENLESGKFTEKGHNHCPTVSTLPFAHPTFYPLPLPLFPTVHPPFAHPFIAQFSIFPTPYCPPPFQVPYLPASSHLRENHFVMLAGTVSKTI